MAKSKGTEVKKAKSSAPIETVKNGAATKPSQGTKVKAKDLAKAAAKKVVKEKEELPKKKVVKPAESDDDSGESESESEQSESESESDSEASESSEESESSEDEAATKGVKTNGHAAAPAAADEDDSEEDSDEDEEEKKAVAAKPVNGKAKPAAKDDDSDDSDSDEDEEDDSDDSDDSESAPAPSKKRKADDEIDATPKKTKTDDNDQAPKTLFAGSLSWGIDDNVLYEAFQEFENLVSARVVTDKMTGRSRGFGYVDFSDADSCTKAYEAMQGKEVDGRAINLDYANQRPTDSTPQNRAADRAQKHGDNVSPESDTLFVGNLPFDIDQDSVHAFFSEVCEVVSVRLPTDPESGSLKGFGYVTFGSIGDAKTVFEQCNGAAIGGGRSSRNVRLDFAGSRPPREGGGFGGGGGGFGGGRGGGRGRGGFGGGRGGGRGRGGDRGRGGSRGGGRGGFGSSRGGSNFSGTKISFD